ncbi:MAG TPA: hypothetical protein ENK57_15925 [Polyangiaceae bacterium]|nr:hypothetical protein [Polyangiaceae bacterium]
MSDNPFERYGIDPTAGPTAITERMRELADELEARGADEEAKQALRADWEDLTLHPRKRLELALAAFPETRPKPEPPARRLAPKRAQPPLEAIDLCWLPSVAEALDLEPPELPKALPTLDDDPILAPLPPDESS